MENLERIIKEAEVEGIQVNIEEIPNKNPLYSIECTIFNEITTFKIHFDQIAFYLQQLSKHGGKPYFKKACSIAWRILRVFMEEHQHFLYYADSKILDNIEEKMNVYTFTTKHPEMNISLYYNISDISMFWVPQSKEDWLEKNFRFYDVANIALQNVEQERELFEYSLMNSGTIRFGTFPIQIYYEGKYEVVQVKITEKGYKLEKKEIENSSFEGLIEIYLEQVKKEMRLINLYEPPKFFLKRMFQNFNRSESFTKTVYQQLTTWYSNKEIETLAKQYYEENLGSFNPYAYQENRNGNHSCKIELFSLFHDKKLLHIHNVRCSKRNVFIGTKKELKEIYEKEISSFLEKTSLF